MKSLLAHGLAFFVLLDASAEWPRFLGPNGSGHATAEARPPLEWSDEKNLSWSTRLPGPGSSCAVVADDRIFLTCYSGYADWSEGDLADLVRHLLCLDRSTGKILWDKTTPISEKEDPFEGFLTEHGYASNTPVTDGEVVIAFFGKAGVVAYDMEGTQLWHRKTGVRSASKVWGSAASPILHGNLVIVNMHDEDRRLAAFDRKTGETVWEVESEKLDLSYGTPAILKTDDREDLVIAVPGEVWGINPSDGSTNWWRYVPVLGNVSASVALSENRVVVFGGYPRTVRIAFDVEGSGDLSDTPIVWESTRAAYLQTPLVIENRLHWVSDTGFARCADLASGDLLYDERIPNASGTGSKGKPFYTSPVHAAERIYMTSRNRGTFVLGAGPDFEILAHNQLSDESLFNSTPTIVGNQLLLRSQTHLYCFEEK